MGCRAGITTRPEVRKREGELVYPDMSNWQLFGPFSNRTAAQVWEDDQEPCDRHDGGKDPASLTAKWHGYRFDF